MLIIFFEAKTVTLLFSKIKRIINLKALLFSQHGKEYQRSYVTKNGLIFNSLAGVYFMSVISTALTCKYVVLSIVKNNKYLLGFSQK
jgi:hypothetical protein